MIYQIQSVIADSVIEASGIFNGIAYEGFFSDLPTSEDVINDIELKKELYQDQDIIDGLTFIQIHVARFGIPIIPEGLEESSIVWVVNSFKKGVLGIRLGRVVDNIPTNDREFKSWEAVFPSLSGTSVEVFGGILTLLVNSPLSPISPITFSNGGSNLFLTTKLGPDLIGEVSVSGQIWDKNSGTLSPGVEIVSFKGTIPPETKVTNNIFFDNVTLTTANMQITRIDVGQVIAQRVNRESFRIRRINVMTKSTASSTSFTIRIFDISRDGRQNIISPIVINRTDSRLFNVVRMMNKVVSNGFYIELVPVGNWLNTTVIVDYEEIE